MVALDSVVTSLLKTLPPLLLKEFNLPKEVAEKIKLLHDQMETLNVILEVSENMQNQHEMISKVVDQLRDALRDAEDVIDTYIYNVNRQRTKPWWDVVNYVDNSIFLHDLENMIDNIKRRIEAIQSNQKFGMEFPHNYQGDAEAAAAAEDLRERRKNVEKDDVIGFEEYSKVVINKLTGGRQERDVITIFGMPGLGKTTLARKVYKSYQVKKYFNFCSWTDVFEDCKVKALLLNLLAQVGSKLNVPSQGMTTEVLKEKLCRSLLEKKRYLIVLDDIWEAEVWGAIKDAFPDDKKGSRILITSRSNQVANFASASPWCKYELPPLDEDKSWELFSKRVFQGETCPPHLEGLGRQMAYSCDGLPLSIVVLAGLMAKLNRSEPIWSIVAGNEIQNLIEQKDKCRDILALSYKCLPRHLKPCFLYVGLYPEDFKIPARQLICQWVAEGLIQHTGNQRPEDVAEYYLVELIDRSLIQVESKRSDGGVKTCCVHDLLRALCIEESKKDKFYDVYVGNAYSTLAKIRRLSLYSRASFYLSSSSSTNHSSVRSLICFAKESIDYRKSYDGWRNDINRRYWESILKDFKLVRLLDIHPARVSFDIPNGIEQLIHLRYLRIEARLVSNNICSIWNLETLDMRGSPERTLPTKISKLKQWNPEALDWRVLPVITLPTQIWKLKRLRHLYMSGSVKMPRMYEPLDNLQTLSTVALEDHMRFVFPMIPMLRKLGLYHSADLRWDPPYVWPEIGILSHLQTLKIIGTTQLPPAHLFPWKLTKLTLKNVDGLPPSIMVLLGDIPNLEILKLSGDSFNLYEFDMDCKTGKFQKLKFFQLKDLLCRNWNLASGSMRRLQILSIINCRTLNMLPYELWALDDLRNVQVLSPSKPLADMLGKLKMKEPCTLTIL